MNTATVNTQTETLDLGNTNLDLRTEAVEESLSCAVAVFTHSEGVSRERSKYLRSHSRNIDINMERMFNPVVESQQCIVP